MPSLPRINRREAQSLLVKLGFKQRLAHPLAKTHEVYAQGMRTVFVPKSNFGPTGKDLINFYRDLGLKKVRHEQVKDLVRLPSSQARLKYKEMIHPKKEEVKIPDQLKMAPESGSIESAQTPWDFGKKGE